jgi:hypothetical protein
MKYSSADFGFITIGQYNLTPVTTKFEDSIEKPAIDSTPFGVTAPQRLPAVLTDYTLTGQDGWYDDATNSINDAMVSMASAERVMILSPYGNSAPATGVGKTCVCTDGVLTTAYKRVDAVGEYIKANFEIAVSGQVDQRAKLVAELAARNDAATTSATYLDMGAAGAAGGRMYLVVTSITWDTQTALTVTLQDCATTGGAYSDHTAFTDIAAPATGGSEMKVLEHAACNRYVAATFAFTGGAGGHCTAAVAVVFD